MTIAIIGAGTLGTALAHEFASRGHETRVISRGTPHGELPHSVGHVQADARDAQVLADALGDATIALQTSQPPYPKWGDEFPALQLSVIAAAAATGAKIVLADNLYMYGSGDGGTITDDTAETPISAKGEVRKAMADEALAAHADGRVQLALTRPSNYVGAGYELTRTLLTDRARAGKAMQVLGRLNQPHSFSYVPDVARAMADIALADDAYGRAWILPAMEPVTQRELCDALWTGVGQEGPAKVQALRGRGARAIGLFNPMVRASIEMLYEWDEPFVVRARDFEQRFGWTATPFAEAAAETAAGQLA